MIVIRFPKVALMAGMALLVIGLPVLADELRVPSSRSTPTTHGWSSTTSWPSATWS
jgi:hypothetical protein